MVIWLWWVFSKILPYQLALGKVTLFPVSATRQHTTMAFGDRSNVPMVSLTSAVFSAGGELRFSGGKLNTS